MLTAITPRKLSQRARNVIISVTLASGAVILITCLWHFSSDIIPSFGFPLQFFAGLVAAGALVANLAVALFFSGRKSRILHAGLALTFPLVFTVWLASARHHVSLRQIWFMTEGVKQYQGYVEAIETMRPFLTDQPQPFSSFGTEWDGVSARTNTDGSVTVWFKPRDNNSRLGYLHNSGGLLTADPFDPTNPNFYHLTNGWYQF